jgi:hypothetical protein
VKVAVIRGPGLPGPYGRCRGEASLALDGHDTSRRIHTCRGEACLALVNHDAREH